MSGPDAATIGLLICACTLLLVRPSLLAHGFSAVCCALAVWSKQSVITALIVPPCFLLITQGTRPAIRYGSILAGALFILTIMFVLAFGGSRLWFHMVTISANHSFQDNAHGNVVAILYGIGDWLADAIEPLVLVAVMVLIGAGKAIRIGRSTPAWMLFATMGIVLLPSSVLGYIKVGGFYNNFALTNYFLLLAAMVGIVDGWPGFLEKTPELARLAMSAASVYLVSQAVLQGVVREQSLSRMVDWIAHPARNVHELVYAYAAARPGEIWFPWNNLSTLLAEGRMYHFEWGVVDRLEAGNAPTSEQLAKGLPPNMRYVAFAPRSQSFRSLEIVPGFTQRVSLDALKDFVVIGEMPQAKPARRDDVPASVPTPNLTPLGGSDFSLSPSSGGH
jgi:hypothetical protein